MDKKENNKSQSLNQSQDIKSQIKSTTENLDVATLEKRLETLENYINILNHDLRSPLATIIGYSSFLIEDELTREEIKKYSTVINKSGKKMLQMMESHLSLAKIERGHEVQGKKMIKTGRLIDKINKNFLELMNQKKINLILRNLENREVDINLLEKNILVDETLIYSVVNNLIRNAIDASLNKEDEIDVNIYESDNVLHLNFFNKGEISKEFQKKLFKKFSSTKKHGTGIGLYSARLIARAHQGDVLYEHVEGGTRFILQIPFV